MRSEATVPDADQSKILSEDSPSVQAHLGILQGVIERMAANSGSVKTWCIALVSAILVIVADTGKPEYALLAIIPIVLFCALDSYYLAMEKGFRNAYNSFVQKVHAGKLVAADLFYVVPQGPIADLLRSALKSFSVWGFYLVLGAMVVLAWLLIL